MADKELVSGAGEDPHPDHKPDPKLLELATELSKVREELANFKTSETKTVFINKDRKLQKFSGRPTKETDLQIEDWIEDAGYHMRSMPGKAVQLEFLFDHLQGQARDEVRVLPEKDRNTPDKIFDILRILFQDEDTVAQIQQSFYQRVQRAGESLQQYSLVLMKIIDRLIKKQKGAIGDKELMLKERFIDGVKDLQLKREMRRFAMDHPSATFNEFRGVVLKWCEDEVKVKGESIQANTHEVEQLDVSTIKSIPDQSEIMKLLQNQQDLLEKQQKQLDHLSQLVGSNHSNSQNGTAPAYIQRGMGTGRRPWGRGGTSGWSRGRGRGACFRCGNSEHFIRDCPETEVKKGLVEQGKRDDAPLNL